MNNEERFERIEHVIAGLAEQRREDREEYRQLWRDTERQLRESIRKTNEAIDRFAEESRAADADLGRRIAETDKQSKIRDEQLGRRIESLVSSIGELVTMLKPQK
jgi:hypothetical protein